MSYVEYLIYSLKNLGENKAGYLKILEEEIIKTGTTSEEIIRTLHFDMAVRRISISNSIMSMKNILRFNWSNVFEKINSIENILMQDEKYKMMDFNSKAMYRSEIKKIAKIANVSEIYLSNVLIATAKEKNKHIGFFLFKDEREILARKLNCSKVFKKKMSNNIKLLLYLGAIYIPTVILSLVYFRHAFIIALVPVSEAFVLLVNKIVMKIKKPKLLFRMEEIDNKVNTFVVVPTLITNKEETKRVISNLEVFYLANKNSNIKLCLLGDPTESDTFETEEDAEIINTGIEETQKLNKKYKDDIFFFLYRKRVFNKSQEKYLGYERKRGMITEFVHFLVTGEEGTFIVNTISSIPNTKYVITIDSDTNLILGSAKKLIGIMEHPLNELIIENNIVVDGYGLIQPKIGVSIEKSSSSLFAKLFAGNGGLDMYSGAESNIYQDLFSDAIFTGKGIFRVNAFENLLKGEIQDNTVLSHDLLEGSFLKVGLASDVLLLDGFPSKFNSYIKRLKRWTRGDVQLLRFLKNKKLNSVSKYKIIDNIRRSTYSIFVLLLMFFGFAIEAIALLFVPLFIDILSSLLFINTEEKKSKSFFFSFGRLIASFDRCLFELLILPYKALQMLEAIIITLYRMFISKKKLLEWTTAAECEMTAKNTIKSYYSNMSPSFILVISLLATTFFYHQNLFALIVILSLGFFLSPAIAYLISNERKAKPLSLKKEDNDFLKNVAKNTWDFFASFISEENNYLMPDNYEDIRKNKLCYNTSSTNIGLSMIAVISAKDMGFIDNTHMVQILRKIIDNIISLEKWNGHLYNWYDVKSKKPLEPRFVSTVDSGNFISYLYVVKNVLDKSGEQELSEKVQTIIDETDFSKLFDYNKNLFSIGYDDKEKRLSDSYYDLLASEARSASFVAIAKNDIPYKHYLGLREKFYYG